MPFFFGVVFLALVLSVLAVVGVVSLTSAGVSAFCVVGGFVGVVAGFVEVAGVGFVAAGVGFAGAGVAGVVVDVVAGDVVVDVVAGGVVVSSFTGVIAADGSGSGLLCTLATNSSMPLVSPS